VLCIWFDNSSNLLCILNLRLNQMFAMHLSYHSNQLTQKEAVFRFCLHQGCGNNRIFFALTSSLSWSVMIPSLHLLPHTWNFLLLFLALYKVGCFLVCFQLSKCFHFCKNFTAFSFRFLSNGMLTVQHKTENLVYRKSVKFAA